MYLIFCVVLVKRKGAHELLRDISSTYSLLLDFITVSAPLFSGRFASFESLLKGQRKFLNNKHDLHTSVLFLFWYIFKFGENKQLVKRYDWKGAKRSKTALLRDIISTHSLLINFQPVTIVTALIYSLFITRRDEKYTKNCSCERTWTLDVFGSWSMFFSIL